MIIHSSYICCLLEDKNLISDYKITQWLDSLSNTLLYDIIKNLIEDHLIMSNQFMLVLSAMLNNRNIRIKLQHARYTNDANILIHLLINSKFNDKYVILCTELYKKHILRNNDADNRGLGLFENGILVGHNLDALYALPSINRTDPVFLNKWLLYSYIKGHDNVLVYMIRRSITIKKPYKIIRLIIMLGDVNDLTFLFNTQNKYHEYIDNYGNTPLLFAKAVGNEKAEEIILKYNPNLNHKNKFGATYFNLVKQKLTLCDNPRPKIILKNYDDIASKIKPYQTWKSYIAWFILKNMMFLIILVLYHLI